MKINITTNLKTVIFLDITFNLCTGKYRPYKKPNDTQTYINANSNHPANIIKGLLDNISKQISNISFHKATFNNAASLNNEVVSARVGAKKNLNVIAERRIIVL